VDRLARFDEADLGGSIAGMRLHRRGAIAAEGHGVDGASRGARVHNRPAGEEEMPEPFAASMTSLSGNHGEVSAEEFDQEWPMDADLLVRRRR